MKGTSLVALSQNDVVQHVHDTTQQITRASVPRSDEVQHTLNKREQSKNRIYRASCLVADPLTSIRSFDLILRPERLSMSAVGHESMTAVNNSALYLKRRCCGSNDICKKVSMVLTQWTRTTHSSRAVPKS